MSLIPIECHECGEELVLDIDTARFIALCRKCNKVVGHFDGEDVILKEFMGRE